MNCPRCGAIAELNARFCGQCGERLINAGLGGTSMTHKIMSANEVKYKLGVVYFKKGKTQQAIEMWQQVLRNDPDHKEAQRMLQEAKAQL